MAGPPIGYVVNVTYQYPTRAIPPNQAGLETLQHRELSQSQVNSSSHNAQTGTQTVRTKQVETLQTGAPHSNTNEIVHNAHVKSVHNTASDAELTENPRGNQELKLSEVTPLLVEPPNRRCSPDRWSIAHPPAKVCSERSRLAQSGSKKNNF